MTTDIHNGSVFVQSQVCWSTPLPVATLIELLGEVPQDAAVEVDDELIVARWNRMDPPRDDQPVIPAKNEATR